MTKEEALKALSAAEDALQLLSNGSTPWYPEKERRQAFLTLGAVVRVTQTVERQQ